MTLTPTTRLTMTRTLAIVIATKGLIITMMTMTRILSENRRSRKDKSHGRKSEKKKEKENERYDDNGYVRRALGGISLVIIVITSRNQTQAAAPIYNS